MMDMYEKILGALIGLARATDGNEHLINQSVTNVIIESLTASKDDLALLESLHQRAGEEKRKMVPNCFLCANPCGRTSDYDLSMLAHADPQVYKMKLEILSELRRIAMRTEAYDCRILYKGLVVIGMDDYTADDLMPIIKELESIA